LSRRIGTIALLALAAALPIAGCGGGSSSGSDTGGDTGTSVTTTRTVPPNPETNPSAFVSLASVPKLGLVLTDSLTRLNALKQALSFSANLAAAVFFVFSGKVVWSVALVMALGALVGGSIGGHFASRVNPLALRRAVVAVGCVVGVIYLVK
jgi:hypothetical protein